MSSEIDTSFVLGYGGMASIQMTTTGTSSNTTSTTTSTFVPILNGSVERKMQVGFVTSYHVPFSDEARSKIRMNTGTYTFSGSISFQMTSGLASLFLVTSFFSRKNMFTIVMCDGEYTLTLPNCVWSSFNITGQPNGAVTGSLSFSSTNNGQTELNVTQTFTSYTIQTKDALQPYWKYGSSNEGTQVVDSFSLNFSRNVTPVFLNNNKKTPTYLRAGMLDVEMQISCLQKWFDLSSLSLGSKTITFNGSFVSVQSFQHGGMQESMKQFSVKGTASATSEVFSLS